MSEFDSSSNRPKPRGLNVSIAYDICNNLPGVLVDVFDIKRDAEKYRLWLERDYRRLPIQGYGRTMSYLLQNMLPQAREKYKSLFLERDDAAVFLVFGSEGKSVTAVLPMGDGAVELLADISKALSAKGISLNVKKIYGTDIVGARKKGFHSAQYEEKYLPDDMYPEVVVHIKPWQRRVDLKKFINDTNKRIKELVDVVSRHTLFNGETVDSLLDSKIWKPPKSYKDYAMESFVHDRAIKAGLRRLYGQVMDNTSKELDVPRSILNRLRDTSRAPHKLAQEEKSLAREAANFGLTKPIVWDKTAAQHHKREMLEFIQEEFPGTTYEVMIQHIEYLNDPVVTVIMSGSRIIAMAIAEKLPGGRGYASVLKQQLLPEHHLMQEVEQLYGKPVPNLARLLSKATNDYLADKGIEIINLGGSETEKGHKHKTLNVVCEEIVPACLEFDAQ